MSAGSTRGGETGPWAFAVAAVTIRGEGRCESKQAHDAQAKTKMVKGFVCKRPNCNEQHCVEHKGSHSAIHTLMAQRSMGR